MDKGAHTSAAVLSKTAALLDAIHWVSVVVKKIKKETVTKVSCVVA